MSSVLILGIIILGFAVMFGGKGAAGKLINVVLGFFGKLILDMVTGILKLAFSVLDKGLRALGRLIDRGIRRLFRLKPTRRPQLPHRP